MGCHMALLLKHEDVQASVSMLDAIAAMEQAFAEEGEGAAFLPQRINMKAGNGWFRVGPVALEKSGLMGFKAMNLAPGHGLRYQVHCTGSRPESCYASWMHSISQPCAPAQRVPLQLAGSHAKGLPPWRFSGRAWKRVPSSRPCMLRVSYAAHGCSVPRNPIERNLHLISVGTAEWKSSQWGVRRRRSRGPISWWQRSKPKRRF